MYATIFNIVPNHYYIKGGGFPNNGQCTSCSVEYKTRNKRAAFLNGMLLHESQFSISERPFKVNLFILKILNRDQVPFQ